MLSLWIEIVYLSASVFHMTFSGTWHVPLAYRSFFLHFKKLSSDLFLFEFSVPFVDFSTSWTPVVPILYCILSFTIASFFLIFVLFQLNSLGFLTGFLLLKYFYFQQYFFCSFFWLICSVTMFLWPSIFL